MGDSTKSQCINLLDAIKIILDFNETIQLDLVWASIEKI